MSVSIRLKRMGRKNRPFYRLVVADTLRKREGSYLENLGWYDPLGKEEKNYSLNLERISYWKGQGARISSTINSLVRKEGGFSTQKQVIQGSVAPEPADLVSDSAESPAS